MTRSCGSRRRSGDDLAPVRVRREQDGGRRRRRAQGRRRGRPGHRGRHGPAGARTVPITEFFTGFYETVLRDAEVLTGIDVPAIPADARWRYLKWTPRAQEDKALVGLAAMLVLDGRRCRVARLAVGGV